MPGRGRRLWRSKPLSGGGYPHRPYAAAMRLYQRVAPCQPAIPPSAQSEVKKDTGGTTHTWSGGGGLDTERNWPLHPRQQILIPVQPPKEWSEGERFSAAEHQNITKIKKNWSNNGLRSLVLTTLLSFCSLLALIYFESNKCQRCHH